MISVAILGFGVVGGGTAELLTRNADAIARRVGDTVRVKSILDIRTFPDSPFADRITSDFDAILRDPEISVVAEVMGGVHPAREFSLAALAAGKSVVTSNKELVAKHGHELLAEARAHGVQYCFEASVGGGIPVITPLLEDLAVNRFSRVCGILNGTTNYILTRMFGAGKSFEEALAEAQQKGYAEKNPSADVDGYDTARKICILSALLWGVMPREEEIAVEGIRGVTPDAVRDAGAAGCSIKLLGRAEKTASGVQVLVAPHFVPAASPLCGIQDVFNGVEVTGDFVGDVMFYGRGAGAAPTASAVCADIARIAGGEKLAAADWRLSVAGEIDATGPRDRWYAAGQGVREALGGQGEPVGSHAVLTVPMTADEMKAKLSGVTPACVMRTLL